MFLYRNNYTIPTYTFDIKFSHRIAFPPITNVKNFLMMLKIFEICTNTFVIEKTTRYFLPSKILKNSFKIQNASSV